MSHSFFCSQCLEWAQQSVWYKFIKWVSEWTVLFCKIFSFWKYYKKTVKFDHRNDVSYHKKLLQIKGKGIYVHEV